MAPRLRCAGRARGGRRVCAPASPEVSDAPWTRRCPSITPLAFAGITAALLLIALAGVCLRPAAVVRHPWRVLLAIGGLSLASVLVLVRFDPPAIRLAIDPSSEPLLPASDPARAVYRDAVRDFGDDEVYVIAMESEDVFTADNLSRLRRLSEAIERLPGVRRVQSIVDVTSFRWDPAEQWIEVRPLVEDIPSDPAELAELRSRALASPLYRRSLVSADGRAAALNVSFRKMSDRDFIASGLDDRIATLLEGEAAPRRALLRGRPAAREDAGLSHHAERPAAADPAGGGRHGAHARPVARDRSGASCCPSGACSWRCSSPSPPWRCCAFRSRS